MISDEPKRPPTNKVVPKHLSCPNCRQHFTLIAAVVGLVFVKGTADAGTHVFIPVFIQLAQDSSNAPVGEVRVQDQLLVVVDTSQH